MSFSYNTADYKGGGAEPGTYACRLHSIEVYQNEKWQLEETRTEVTLVWAEEDGDTTIRDSWLNFSLNDGSNLTSRIRALIGGTNFQKVTLKTEGDVPPEEAPHWRQGTTKVTSFRVDDQELLGTLAYVTVVQNDKGFSRVASVAPPVRARPAAAPPEGMPA